MKKKNPGAEDANPQNPPGDPIYGPGEDIFSRARKSDIDPETQKPFTDEFTDDEDWNEKELDDNDDLGADLDVPGSELDDDDELIGEEDEENNYYSLGGDNHENLRETNADDVDSDS